MNTLRKRPLGSTLVSRTSNFPARALIFLIISLLTIPVVSTISSTSTGGRGALALILTVLALILLSFSPQAGMSGILLFLCLLGGLRRWLIPIFGWPDSDPLLLVAPAVVVIYVVNLALRRMLPHDTELSRCLPWLLGLMALEIFNPLQGGLMIGLSGTLFFIIPILWYFVGRRIGTETLTTGFFRVVISIAILAALYGLYQLWFGFTESEKQWLKIVSTYAALGVGNTTRAFSFFISPSEYAQFLGFGIVLAVAAILKGHRGIGLLLPLLGVAAFLTSERGRMVAILTTCTVLWAVQGRTFSSWLPRGVIAAVIAICGLVWSLHQAESINFSKQAQDLVTHQTEGLLDPLNPEHSTAQGHANMVWVGIVHGFTNPLGRGLGASNLAGTKYSENPSSGSSDNPGNGSSEVDISNAFISLGCVGGLLYLSIQFIVLKRAFQHWQRCRSQVALGLLAILLVSLGQWMSMGHYAGFTLDWFCIGALDKLEKDRSLAAGKSRQYANSSRHP